MHGEGSPDYAKFPLLVFSDTIPKGIAPIYIRQTSPKTCRTMPNQRKETIERVTITMEAEMLAQIERLVEARQAEDPKYDRLDLIREAIDHALAGKCHGFKEG